MSSQCFLSLNEAYWSSENIMKLDCHRYNVTDVDISTVSYNTKRTYDWKMENMFKTLQMLIYIIVSTDVILQQFNLSMTLFN
jgi:hypothetical protein